MNLLVLSLALTMSLSSSSAEEMKRIGLASIPKGSGFQMKGVSTESQSNIDVEFTYLRPSDNARLRLRLYEVNSQEEANSMWSGLLMQAIYRDLPVAFSGNPIGDATRRYASGSRTALDTRFGLSFVQTTIEYRTRLETSINTPERVADRAVCEGITRRAIAGLANLDVRPSPVNSVKATGSSGNLIGPKGEGMVDLAAYVKQVGGSLRIERDSELAYVTRGRTEVVIALGSSQLRIGGQTIKSKDVVVARAGKWFVPLGALRKALAG